MAAAGIVVVGAGPSGARCAVRCAERGLPVTLLGAEPGLPYHRVALSRFLVGDCAEEELFTHDQALLDALRIDYRHGVMVEGIDRQAGILRTADGSAIAYDNLVLALGAQAFRLPLPGASRDGVLMYRTLADVQAMLAAASLAGGSAVVIGGGLLGIEAAVGLAQRGMRVTVLHAVDRLMERQLDAEAAGMLARRLEAKGIAFHLAAATAAIEGETRVSGVRLADGTRIAADIVVMAVGIRPETGLARAAGLAVGRGITVDAAMRSSDPAIFAIGECAEHDGQLIGLVAPAYAQAEVAAAKLAGEAAQYVPEVDATALKVAGAGVWSAGEIADADAEAIVYRDPEAGEYRRFLLRGSRLVGAMLYGDTGEAAWYRGLIDAGADMDPLRAALPFGRAYAGEGLAA